MEQTSPSTSGDVAQTTAAAAAAAAASGTADANAAAEHAETSASSSAVEVPGAAGVGGTTSNQVSASVHGVSVESASDADSSDTDSQSTSSSSSSSRGSAASTGAVASQNSRAGNLTTFRVDEALRALSQPSGRVKLIRKFLQHQEDIFAQFPEIYKVQEDLWLLESHIASLHEAGPRVSDVAVFRIPTHCPVTARSSILDVATLDGATESVETEERVCKVIKHFAFIQAYAVVVIPRGEELQSKLETWSSLSVVSSLKRVVHFPKTYQLLRVRRSDFVKIAVPGTDVQDCVQWAQNFEESNDEVSSEPIRSNESKSSSKLPSAVAGEGAGGGGAQTDSSAPAAEHCDDAASPSIAGSFKARPRYHLAVGQRLVGTICVPNVFNDSDDEEHADDDDELDTWALRELQSERAHFGPNTVTTATGLRRYYLEVVEAKTSELGNQAYYACRHRCYGDEQVCNLTLKISKTAEDMPTGAADAFPPAGKSDAGHHAAAPCADECEAQAASHSSAHDRAEVESATITATLSFADQQTVCSGTALLGKGGIMHEVRGVVRQKMHHVDAANSNFFFVNDESTHKFFLEPEIPKPSPGTGTGPDSISSGIAPHDNSASAMPTSDNAGQPVNLARDYDTALAQAAKVQRVIYLLRSDQADLLSAALEQLKEQSSVTYQDDVDMIAAITGQLAAVAREKLKHLSRPDEAVQAMAKRPGENIRDKPDSSSESATDDVEPSHVDQANEVCTREEQHGDSLEIRANADLPVAGGGGNSPTKSDETGVPKALEREKSAMIEVLTLEEAGFRNAHQRVLLLGHFFRCGMTFDYVNNLRMEGEAQCMEMRRQAGMIDNLVFKNAAEKEAALAELGAKCIDRKSWHEWSGDYLQSFADACRFGTEDGGYRGLISAEEITLFYVMLRERIQDGYTRFSCSLRACDSRVPQDWLSQYSRIFDGSAGTAGRASNTSTATNDTPDFSTGAGRAHHDVVGGGSVSAEPVGDAAEEAANNAVTCVVCFCSIDEGDVMIELPCGHLFHDECVRPWFHSKTSCPLCRTEIPRST